MLEHILRRLGFGASPAELASWAAMPVESVIDRLLNFEGLSTDHDAKIGLPEFVGITTQSGQPFSPNTLINDARQRWLFRMLHSQRPLEEKMALFWHNHFATAYTKIAGAVGQERATRMMDNDPASLAGSEPGQIQKLRQLGTGSFATLLWEMAKDPAMIYWLDSQLNTRTRPQENFGREIMELFSLGIGPYTEADVYAAARVFTGFNWQILGDRTSTTGSWYAYQYRPNDHDTSAKTFTFAIYPDGGKTIPARPAAQGEQDALDLVLALTRNPATGRRLAIKLYKFFVNETAEPDQALISAMTNAYLGNNYNIKAVLRTLVASSQFRSPANFFQRYSWPAEFVVRAIKETGWTGFSVANALTPMANMGQQLYEPPDVNGWELGPGWISTSSMLTRMNFASTLAANQRFNLARDLQPYRQSPDRIIEYMLSRFRTMGFSQSATTAMTDYLRSTTWTGSDTQLQQRIPGLTRLIVGSGEYVFN
ncbi:MAG TPA: DUF1800 domain-containing protein [Vicinamibacterales bacterium]|nr:DUF1800 domain-containing protein [Vicinamibacterales bacterium]